MDTKTNSILSQLVSVLEAAGMKCSACGCSLAKGEAKKAGDGEMLCEACWGESAEMEAKGFECKECGKKFSKPTDECPKCGGSDIDLAEMADANDEDSLDEGGAKFKKLVSQFKKRGDIEDPKALAAWIGRKKYGKSKFQKMAVAGRKSKG